MATNKLQWKRIAKGDRLPCDSLLMEKDGTIPSVVSGAGVKVGQDAYYLPVDDVIEELRNYPIEESEDERVCRKLIAFLKQCKAVYGDGFKQFDLNIDDAIAWLEKQGEPTDILANAVLDSNKDGLIADTIRCKTEKSCEHCSDEQTRINLLSFINTWGKAKLPLTSVNRFVNYLEKQGEKKSAAWSEEDEKVLDNILYILNQLKDTTPHKEDETAKECIDKLKSLKDRFTWKPSDEQIVALKHASNDCSIAFADMKILATLYEQLKALHRYEQDT